MKRERDGGNTTRSWWMRRERDGGNTTRSWWMKREREMEGILPGAGG